MKKLLYIKPLNKTFKYRKLVTFAILIDLRDIWIGLHWNSDQFGNKNQLSLYVCLIPCIVLRLQIADY